MRHPISVIKQWLEAIHDDSAGLTKWEEDFVDSLAAQVEARGTLSERQEEILERIFVEKTP